MDLKPFSLDLKTEDLNRPIKERDPEAEWRRKKKGNK